jgi:protein SCO1/2
MFRYLQLFSVLVLLATAGCERKSPGTIPAASRPAEPDTNQQVFEVKGIVRAVKTAQVEIKHEAIPGYMPSMTMPFDVKDTNELAGLQPGQTVQFRLTVTATDAWIDQIHQVGDVFAKAPPANAPIRLAQDVETLQPGSSMPSCQLTNELGEAFSTSQFKGQALAFTFLFTRCPYPTFCPRMATYFQEAQKKLLALPNAPTNWHLLTISFDPAFDKPEVLKSYAQAHQYDPAHWTFATGSLIDITAFSEQFGLQFWHDETGSLSHNLRTVVVDAKGRVVKIFAGNEWTSDELVKEIVKAAGRS